MHSKISKYLRLTIYSYLTNKEQFTTISKISKQEREILLNSSLAAVKREFTLKVKDLE